MSIFAVVIQSKHANAHVWFHAKMERRRRGVRDMRAHLHLGPWRIRTIHAAVIDQYQLVQIARWCVVIQSHNGAQERRTCLIVERDDDGNARALHGQVIGARGAAVMKRKRCICK